MKDINEIRKTNARIIKIHHRWVKKCFDDPRSVADANFLHNSLVGLPLFEQQQANDVDIESLLPAETQKGNTLLEGRLSAFYTECVKELIRICGPDAKIMLPIDKKTDKSLIRGINQSYLKQFILIVGRKLNII